MIVLVAALAVCFLGDAFARLESQNGGNAGDNVGFAPLQGGFADRFGSGALRGEPLVLNGQIKSLAHHAVGTAVGATSW